MTETLDQHALRIWHELKVDWSQRLYLPSSDLVNTNCDDFISEFARRLLAEQAQGDPNLYVVADPDEHDFETFVDKDEAESAALDFGTVAIPLYAAPPQDSLDAKRLDWMEKNVSAIRDIGWLGGSLRAAIDAAMRKESHD